MKQDLRKIQRSAKSYDRVVRTTCTNFCQTGCGMKVFVSQGRIVDIYGDEDHPINKGSLCPRGATAYQEVYNPSRLRHPLMRHSLADEFRQASWEEALAAVASGLRSVKQKYGSEAVHIYNGRSANFGSVALSERFGRMFGARRFGGFAPPLRRSAAEAGRRMFGASGSGYLMNPPQDWPNSGCILVIGSAISSEVILAGWLIDARDRGTNVIWIDTRQTPLTAKATTPIIVRPGAELAVLMSMINVIIGEELYDREFVKRWVQGFDELRAFCREYAPEAVQEMSWVPADAIRSAAHTFAEGHPCQVIGGLESPCESRSYGLALASGALLSLTGSIGVKGGGWNWLWCGQPPFDALEGSQDQDIERAGTDSESFTASQRRGPDTLQLRNVSGRGRSFREDAIADRACAKAMILEGDIMAVSSASSIVRHLSSDSELTVQLATVLDDACQNAHIVLPVATWLEEDGLVHHTHYRSLQWRNGVVPPPPECRSASDFWVALAEAFGWGRLFPWREADGSVSQRQLADYFLQRQPLVAGCSVDLIDPETNPPGGIMWPCATSREAGFEPGATTRGRWLLCRADDFSTKAQRFTTATGKIELAVKELRHVARDQSLSPRLAKEGELARRYPLVLTTGRLQGAFGDVAGKWPWTADRTRDRAVRVHPSVAALVGVQDGDLVTLECQEGAVEAEVLIDITLDPRCVWRPVELVKAVPEQEQPGACAGFEFEPQHDGARVRMFMKGQDADAVSADIVRTLFREPRAARSRQKGAADLLAASNGGNR